MKKSIAFILLLVITISAFTSCDLVDKFNEKSNVSSEISSFVENATNKESSTTSLSDKSSKVSKGSSSKKQTATSKPAKPSADASSGETIVTDQDVKEPKNVGKIKELKLNNKHTCLKSSSYYQYASLSGKDKAIYNRIVDTIKASRNIVSLADLSPTSSQVSIAFQRVLTDCPQYFYVSRVSWFIYGAESNVVRSLVLSYSDGEVADELDDNLNFTKTANRTLINQQIDSLQSEIEKILSNIPSEDPELIKERKIFDYIVKYVKYDKNAAEKVGTFTVTPHAFDLYGAAVKKKAVCEGYTKLFQYLCYCVGINSTQVSGTARGEGHMWNAVLIEKEWYQTDLTWSVNGVLPYYGYFNLTTNDILKDRDIEPSELSIPNCTSTKNSFLNTFAVFVKTTGKSPENYENSIANIKKMGDKMIYIYFEECALGKSPQISFVEYMNKYMFFPTTQFCTYLSNQGIKMSQEFKKVGDFYLIMLY